MLAQDFKRGAIPSSTEVRAAIKAYVPREEIGAPMSYCVIPPQLSVWGNDIYGDCVTAEEAFAKACSNPEIFINSDDVVAWAKAHGVIDGATLPIVLNFMQTDGFDNGSPGAHQYDDGAYASVDFTSWSRTTAAISEGPVKLCIAGEQVGAAFDAGGGRSGWIGTGFSRDTPFDHCVSLCGYGTIAYLAQRLGVSVPSGVDSSRPAYAMFTWGTIGIVDAQSMVNITCEAYLRTPNTVVMPPKPGASFLPMGRPMNVGGTLLSDNGLYFAVMQGDGNLCVYAGTPEARGSYQWASQKTGPGGEFFTIMQSDGNLCTYYGSVDNKGAYLWGTQSLADGGEFFLVMQGDGNLCVYKGTSPSDNKGFVWGWK